MDNNQSGSSSNTSLSNVTERMRNMRFESSGIDSIINLPINAPLTLGHVRQDMDDSLKNLIRLTIEKENEKRDKVYDIIEETSLRKNINLDFLIDELDPLLFRSDKQIREELQGKYKKKI